MPLENKKKLNDAREIMFRQVHPNMMSKGRLWSGAFKPTKSDKGFLSADRGALITPRQAYERYLESKKLRVAGGTWGVSVQEFLEIGLHCYSDPKFDNDAHALVDFASAGADKEEGFAKLAYAKAVTRGRLYPNDAEDTSSSAF